MSDYAGLDVLLKEVSICVMDGNGQVLPTVLYGLQALPIVQHLRVMHIANTEWTDDQVYGVLKEMISCVVHNSLIFFTSEYSD